MHPITCRSRGFLVVFFTSLFSWCKKRDHSSVLVHGCRTKAKRLFSDCFSLVSFCVSTVSHRDKSSRKSKSIEAKRKSIVNVIDSGKASKKKLYSKIASIYEAPKSDSIRFMAANTEVEQKRFCFQPRNLLTWGFLQMNCAIIGCLRKTYLSLK